MTYLNFANFISVSRSFDSYSVISAGVARPSQSGTELCHVQEPHVLDDECRASEVSGDAGGPAWSGTI